MLSEVNFGTFIDGLNTVSDEQVGGWVEGWIDGSMDGRMDGRTKEHEDRHIQLE